MANQFRNLSYKVTEEDYLPISDVTSGIEPSKCLDFFTKEEYDLYLEKSLTVNPTSS